MRKTKLTAIFLAICMAASLASCAGSEQGENPGTTSSADTTIAEQEEILPDIPEGYDLKGKEIRVINPQGYISGDAEGDVVSQAEYDMIRQVEETLNCDIVFTDFEGTAYQQIPGVVQRSIESQSDDFDLIFCAARLTMPLLNQGYYRSIHDLTYVNIEKPWWATAFIESIAVDANNPMALVGSINYNYVERLSALFFNKELLSELKNMSEQDLYEIVLDGKWTFDKMSELCRDTYQDLNGNGERDDADLYALTCYTNFVYERMAYCMGLFYTSRDDEGYPVLDLYREQTVDLVTKLSALFFNNEDTLDLQPFSDSNRYDKVVFSEGRSLFLSERFYVAGWDELREMEDDFGIIPYPKYDESIDTYYSVSDTNTLLATVPITAQDTEAISAVAEMMAYYSYRDVVPTYYETALKIKYTRDDTSSQMIDLITGNARTDFLYFNQLDGLGGIFGTLYNEQGENFASLYASLEEPSNEKLQELIDILSNK